MFQFFFLSFSGWLCSHVANFVIVESNVLPQVYLPLDIAEEPPIVVDNSTDYVFVDNIDLKNFPKSFDVKVNNMFTSKELLITIMQMIAIKKNFEFVVGRSCRTRVCLSCKKDGCSWIFRASTLKGKCTVWKVTSYVNAHTRLLDITHNSNRQASCSIVGACMRSAFPD